MKHYSKLKETKISSKTIWKGVLSFNVDTVRLINGKTAKREYIAHPGASAVLAMHEGKILFVEQYRYPAGAPLLEIPAGKIEPGQTPLACAKAELEQETGFKAGKIKKIISFFPAAAFSDEQLHLYFSEDLKPGKINRDADEFLNVKFIPVEDALKLLFAGKIKDSKTIIALSCLAIRGSGGKSFL